MKQKLVLFGFFLFGILYFSNKKGVKKMVPTIVLKYKKLFMGLAVGLVAYAVLHKDVVEEFDATDVPCGLRRERGKPLFALWAGWGVGVCGGEGGNTI